MIHQLFKTDVSVDEISERVTLNKNENRIKNLLLSVAEACKRSGDPVVLRFAGGWVRDKLLGIESHDIDVVVDTMSGYDFAMRLNAYLREHVNAQTKYSRITKIERNPEKSKHLETATTHMMNFAIDFVNLRSEKYSANSRVPIMTFGTPEEDALRRDCTINALFYNLHTSRIEDFTKRGLKDMRLKRISTPLEPYRTFDDDPLRILRCIRFASRFGFEIDPEAKLAMMHPEIKKSLLVKISKERVGIELEKMLKGPDPYCSLILIYELGLYESIFTTESLGKPKRDIEMILPALEFLKWMMYDHPENKLTDITKVEQKDKLENNTGNKSNKDLRKIHFQICSQILNHTWTHPFKTYMDLLGGTKNNMIPWLLSVLVPWKEQVVKNKKINTQCSAIVVRDGLKMSNIVIHIIEDSFTYFQEAQKISHECIEGNMTRLSLGLFIRLVKKNWPFAVFLGLIDDLIAEFLLEINNLTYCQNNTISSLTIETLNNKKQSIFNRYQCLLDKIFHENLQNAYSIQPLVNGHVLSKEFGLKGPQIGLAIEQIIQWQLQNPHGTKEECLKQIKSDIDNVVESKESATVFEEINCTILIKQMPKNNEELQEKIYKMKCVLSILKKSYFEKNTFYNEADVIEIMMSLCGLVSPLKEMVKYDFEEIIPKEILKTYNLLVNICLQCIEILMSFFTFLAKNSQINDKITQVLATYQIKTDPWTSEENYNISLRILETWKKDLMSEEVLIQILMNGIRPYFSFHQNKSTFIDYKESQRKKNTHKRYENIYRSLEDSKEEPWKTEKIECASILEWILFICKKEIVENIFFHVIPPLVILLEDADPIFKLRGARCLHHLLAKCNSTLIKNTGTGDLFWKLFVQCLSYHPPSIHVTISIPLIRTSLNNLLILALLMQPESKSERGKLYDEIIYAGIFNGMLYSGEQLDMVILLMEYTRKLANVMEIYISKHIKMLIPLISSVLENSFQSKHLQHLIEAAKALTTIMRICWPRIEPYHPIILQGVCFCWLNIQSQKGITVSQLKKELCCCVKALKKIMGETLDKDLQALVNADAGLISLFKDI
ncbi:hypothetical protein PORY_001038 [Pneumocystis oryctolagi]|uniref:Uncharacterized protein n=1 Tax=Pneumocystis oryctolagi TaxID=42067 RepID=A0ACB7CEH4_9ASCO|nr:hypothetical protein PORY_001038 [Pneumocystis oryctolagi]